MSDPTFLSDFPWVRTSPVGLRELRKWNPWEFPRNVTELAEPKYQLYLSLFLEWLGHTYPDAAGNYRTVFTANVLGEPPADWPADSVASWSAALDTVYLDFKEDLHALKQRSGESNAADINASLAARHAAELRNAAEDRGVDAWVDAIMAIGAQFAVKQQVNDAVNALGRFEQLGWTKGAAVIDAQIGTAVRDYGPAEMSVRERAAAYKATRDYPDLESMTLALVEFAQTAQALAQSIYDTAEAAVSWAVGYAKDKHIENLANTHPELSEGLLVMSTTVYVISAALGAAGIAFPPAAVAGGVVGALATGIKWLVTKIDAAQAVRNRDHVKQMLTVQYVGADGDAREVVKTLTKIAGVPEKVKSGLELVEKVAEQTGDVLHTARLTDIGSGAKVVAAGMTTPLRALTPLVEAADLALEYLDADPKQEQPRFDPAETKRLLDAIDVAYRAVDPSTDRVDRAESKLIGSVGQGQWSVLLVGADGRRMGGIVDEATMTFQPDRDYTLQEFAKAVQARRTDAKEWFDDDLEATVSATVNLVPDMCRVGDYDVQHASLRVTAPVSYTAEVGDYKTSWIEHRELDVYADGDLGIDWNYDAAPYIPMRVYHDDLLEDSFILDDEHPYRAYAEIVVDDTRPRHLQERSGVTVPDAETEDYRSWCDKVRAKIRDDDEREAKIIDQYLDERERFS